MLLIQSGLSSDIGELRDTLFVRAIVGQQRIGMTALVCQPNAMQNQDVQMPVVVIIYVYKIETTQLMLKPRLFLHFAEGPKKQRQVDTYHDIQILITIQVINNRAASETMASEPSFLRDVRKSRKCSQIGNAFVEHAILFGNVVSIISNRHGRNIVQTTCRMITRIIWLEHLQKCSHGIARSFRLAV